ncbi:sodium:solute symporter [Fibrobacterota bacterium]
MNILDWTIVACYLAGMIGLSVYLSRGQKTVKDYYLGGNNIKWWHISISTMATQCSTNSLLGAPAFVALAAGGGLIWLQYELAVPLAMIFIMIFLLPFYRKAGVVSIYEYLEMRFGPGTRTILSILFQFIRAVSTGVTVYGISIVISECINEPFWICVILIAVITIIYDSIGGMKGVVASDVIQMFVLFFGIIIIIYFALDLVGGLGEGLKYIDKSRLVTLDFAHHGMGDGHKYAFWPMLIGGFFLYVSYYGCDQTQVQRELSSRSIDDSRRSLFMNGVLRFPLVLTYCFAGIVIGAFVVKSPQFLELIPLKDGVREINKTVPIFVLEYLPHGAIGLIIVALFAAAMSSLDSTINSLSATTMRDIYERFISKKNSPRSQLLWSKGTTVFWGGVCTVCAFYLGGGDESIIEKINKIGSLINGPILATFMLAILTRRTNDAGGMIGILAGFIVNLLMANFAKGVSYFWWNIIGWATSFGVGYSSSIFFQPPSEEKTSGLTLNKDTLSTALGDLKWRKYYYILAGYFVVILLVLYLIQSIAL